MSSIHTTASMPRQVNPFSTIPRLYSQKQAACGAFIGGPVGLVYFLKANFAALGNTQGERRVLLAGLVLIPTLIASVVFFPRLPGLVVTIGYVLAARYVVQRYQMPSGQFDFHSNWRVFGYGIVCLLCSSIVVGLPLFALIALGLLPMAP